MNPFKSALRPFLVAVAATALVLVARCFVLIPIFGFQNPVIPFFLAVTAAAWMGGISAGLFATVLGPVASVFVLIGERGWGVALPQNLPVRLVAFVVISGLLNWLIGSLQADRRRIAERQKQLEHEVEERRKIAAVEREQRERLVIEMNRREEAELALREQEERLRLAIEAADIGTWDFNPVTREQEWSSRAKVMCGLSADADVSNISFRDRVHPDDRERVNQAIQRAFDPSGDGVYETEFRIVWPDNTIHWFFAKGQVQFEGEIPNRRASRLIGTALDITQRKQVEEIVRTSESRLKAMMDNTSAVIYLKDVQGRYLMVNRRFEELFNVTQIAGKTDADIFPGDVAIKVQTNDRQVKETGRSLEFEEVVPQIDGPHTYVSVKFPIFDSAGNVTAVGGISTDISDRKKASDALESEQEMLRNTIQFQDHERQLAAYEIHDGLVQYATGALMQLEGIQHQAESGALAQKIENVVGILRKTVEEGRRIISGLHATVLDDCGVVAAVQELIDDQRPHVQVEFVKDDSLGRLARKSEEALYRITQEALTNFYKHSQSNKVRIELDRRGDRVHLEVRDWGVGFNPSVNAQGVHGLRGMTERAKIAGGQCTIENAHGGGTQVLVDLPYVSRN